MSQCQSGKSTEWTQKLYSHNTSTPKTKTSLKYVQQQQALKNNDDEIYLNTKQNLEFRLPSTLDCEISPNYQVQVKTDMYVTNEERYDPDNFKIQTLTISELLEYLTGNNANVAHEEVSDEDQHVRLLLDLDKLNCTKLIDLSDFISNFAKLFIDVCLETPGAEVAYEDNITFDEIIDGARVAIKPGTVPGNPGGAHIIFTTIVTHMTAWKELEQVITKVIHKSKSLAKPLADIFPLIDLQLYKLRKPILRAIYSLKTYNDRCKHESCKIKPCKHEKAKMYIPQENYDFSDYFFTYVPSSPKKCLHVEFTPTVPKPFVPLKNVNTTDLKSPNLFKTLVRIPPLLTLITGDSYNLYFTVISAMTTIANRTNKSEECREIFDTWFQQNQSHKSKRKPDSDWNRLINSSSERRYGENKLRELAEQMDPEGFSDWCKQYLNSEFRHLVFSPIIQADVAKYFGKMNKDVCIYQDLGVGEYLYTFNDKSKIWDKSDKSSSLLNRIYEYFQTKLFELIESTNIELNELAKILEPYKIEITKKGEIKTTSNNAIPDDIKDLVEEYAKEKQNINRITLFQIEVGKVNFREGLIKDLKGILLNNDIAFNSHRHIIPFLNGNLDLKTGKLQNRIQEDYWTVCLPYNFSEVDNGIVNEVKEILTKIVGHNIEELLKWLGYCITGETTNHNILFTLGSMGQNGKNTIAKIYEACLPIFFDTADKQTFAKGYQYFHKQAIHWGFPKRFIFIDELERDALDVDNVKNTGNGYIRVNLMYKTSTQMTLQTKFYITSNHEPKFQVDEGILRRCLLQQLTHRFLKEEEYQEAKDTNEHNIFPIDETLNSESSDFKFNQIEYKLAFIHLLLPYAIHFYKSGMYLKNMRQNFKDFCVEIDQWKQFKIECTEITNNDEDRLGRQRIASAFTEFTGITVSEATARSEFKRVTGLRYEAKWRENSKSTRDFDGPTNQGVFIGVRLKSKVILRDTKDPTVTDD